MITVYARRWNFDRHAACDYPRRKQFASVWSFNMIFIPGTRARVFTEGASLVIMVELR